VRTFIVTNFLEILSKIKYNFDTYLESIMRDLGQQILLDLSKGLGFGLLYNPVIGKVPKEHYPITLRMRRCRRFSATPPK